MNVEHRHFPRMRVSLEVAVFRRDRLVGQLTTKDMSLSGMLLQTEPAKLNPNEMVVLRVWMKGVEHVLRGIVVHASQIGTGIMLIDMNRATWLAIFNFLRELDFPLKMALGTNTQDQQQSTAAQG
jgi:hypothetical protein